MQMESIPTGWESVGTDHDESPKAQAYTPVLETITEQGNAIRIFSTDAAPMDFFCRINGNVRPIRETLYQLRRTAEYEARVARVGRSLYA